MTLLVQVKTAPTVQNQFDLLLKEGEFRSFSVRPLTHKEKLKICGSCGSTTTPFGPFGDGLELDFSAHGFWITFRSREIWLGGKAILRRLLSDPTYFNPRINKVVERLRYHRLRIKPLLKNVGSAVLLSVGLISYPGIPVTGQELKAVVQKQNPSDSGFWISVKLTSYSWREPDHRPFGRHNCIGGDLMMRVEGLKQCAADLSCYPLGTIVCVKTGEVEEFRIVTDRGTAVKGLHHLDFHFDSLAEMNAQGTRNALVMVIRRGWSSK